MKGKKSEYGKMYSGHEKKSPDGLSLPNQNTIIIKIICIVFCKIWKKYNKIHCKTKYT